MKERPILFNSEMVNAILEGRKTQTRRILKKQPPENMTRHCWFSSSTSTYGFTNQPIPSDKWWKINCPFGRVGDRIWVRETWAPVNLYGEIALAYKADSKVIRVEENESFLDEEGFINYDDPRLEKYSFAAWAYDLLDGKEGVWSPSIHMPRWACRLVLEITSIRVERLNDISENDAIAEGCDNSKSEAAIQMGWYERPVRAFSRRWEWIYGKDSWKQNPWVWVIDFNVIQGGES
ncbi:hypothetical protein ACOT19_01065 [Acinetobacter baumannii]